MTIARYCYHCGISHPEHEMRRHTTKNGGRWRCIKSIRASRKPTAERDAFGKIISAINQEISAMTKRKRVCYES